MKSSAALLSLLLPALAQATPLSEDAAVKLAARERVVIDEPIRQGFSAYIGPEHPVVVTSESLLMAFRHVERDLTPTRAQWNSEAEKVPLPVWMDPITGAPAPPKGG